MNVLGYFRDRFLIAFTIKNDNIKSLNDFLQIILKRKNSLEKKYNVIVKRLPIYAEEDTYIEDIEIIKSKEFYFLPLSFSHMITLREYLNSLKEEGKIDLSVYRYLISSIPKSELEKQILYSYKDVIIYEGSKLTIVTSFKYKDNIDNYLNTILGIFKRMYLSIDNIHDFILWIIHKHYTQQTVNGFFISDITFQRREEAGTTRLKKTYDHKGPKLSYSDEVLLGIAKAFSEIIRAARIRVEYNANELEFYIEDRNGLLVFYPMLKGYILSRDEEEKYNNIYRRIKAVYDLTYNVLPRLISTYKNDKKWPDQRELLIKEANETLRKNLERIAIP